MMLQSLFDPTGSNTAASCYILRERGVELCQKSGFKREGIVKGSKAAQHMSMEAKIYGGGVPSVKDGGLCASLQSIGAAETVKPMPCRNVRRNLHQNGIIQLQDEYDKEENEEILEPFIVTLPNYFTATVTSSPRLVDDYRVGGYNYAMAETMLNESILPTCLQVCTPCGLDATSKFKVLSFRRLENVDVFERFQRHETLVRHIIEKASRQAVSVKKKNAGKKSLVLPSHSIESKRRADCLSQNLPSWLQKLSKKNGLSATANTFYLLHGTKSENLESIVQNGLQTKFSLETNPSYGKGLYFTDNACKASQYAGSDGYIMVCRVVLGRVEILSKPCPNRLYPKPGYDSAMAKRGNTDAPTGMKQLHNEFVVYDPRSCYPEFVLGFEEHY